MLSIKHTYFFILLTVSCYQVNGQVKTPDYRKIVLQKAIIDSTLIFGKWTAEGGLETRLTYLGKVTTQKGQTFKIVNSIFIWGLSQRATSRILVFNNADQYLGNYYLTTTSDLPSQMKNGRLLFKNTDSACDKKVITFINLRKGLPQQFFRKCTETVGDFYSFHSE